MSEVLPFFRLLSLPRVVCLQSALSLKICLVLTPSFIAAHGFAACRSRAWVSCAITVQTKIRDCSQSIPRDAGVYKWALHLCASGAGNILNVDLSYFENKNLFQILG